MRGNIVSLIVQKARAINVFPARICDQTYCYFPASLCTLFNVLGIGLIEALNLNESAKPGQTNDP